MAAKNFDVIMQRVLAHEGKFSNDRSDSGHETAWGITIADARHYWKANVTVQEMMTMPQSIALQIYRDHYWAPMRGDDLPSGYDDTVVDYAINSGLGRSGKVLRRLVDLPTTTSVIDDSVIAAVNKRAPVDLIRAMNEERLNFLRSLHTWPVFGNGWSRRVSEVQAFSLQLAAGATPEVPKEPAPGKGLILKPNVVPTTAGGTAGVATVVGLSFKDWIIANPTEAGLIAAGIMVIIGGFIYVIHKSHELAQTTPLVGTRPIPALPTV